MPLFLALPLLLMLVHGASGAAALTTTADLILSHEAANPGETVWAGVRLRMAPKWHTYWENSGDSGIPTRIDWSPVPGVVAGASLWPVPEKFETAGLITFGYHDEVVLIAPVSLAPTAAAGEFELKAKVSWLECILEKCVPGSTNLTARLSVGTQSRLSTQAPMLEAWKKKLPKPQPDNFARAWWEADAGADTLRSLLIEWPESAAVTEADLWPYTTTHAVLRTSVERIAAVAGRIRVRKQVEKTDEGWPRTLTGLLVASSGGEATRKVVEISVQIGSATGTQGVTASTGAAATSSALGGPPKSLLVWLGTAFLGGLILNLMPCVLPVIALKIFGFVSQAQESPRRVRQLGIIYMFGVVASFLVLAGAVIGLQQVGRQVSWGMQFGDARFLVIMTTLATLVSLNLFGVFEVTLGGRALGGASELAGREGAGGAFFNGVLATALSTPCSAPFLAGALGFAFAARQPFTIVLIFVMIGLGLATPYVVLSFEPRWLRFLPKPGAWMERFKVLMGFPMLATAVWLFTLTVDHYADVLWLGFFLVLLSMSAWVFGQFVQRGQTRRGLASAIAVGILITGYSYGLESKLRWREPRAASTATAGADEIIKESPDGIEWRRWSPAKVAAARAQGRPVFVDFTAKWCTTCNLNKNTSIEIASVRNKLKEINALPLLADYTRLPEDITEELQRFGRAAVPLVLVYPRDASLPPVELPTVLTPGTVLDALTKAAK